MKNEISTFCVKLKLLQILAAEESMKSNDMTTILKYVGIHNELHIEPCIFTSERTLFFHQQTSIIFFF